MPAALRGDLTKWCQQIQTGVYVGNVNARVREQLWERIVKNIGQGEATLVYNTNNELGYMFRTTRKDKEVIDADGIPLVKSLFQAQATRHGFSNAYKYHQAKKFSHPKIKGLDFVSLDLETSGLNPSTAQIISIGAVKRVAGHTTTFYRLVKLESGKKVPVDIARMTGLNNERLAAEGVLVKEALIDLQAFTKGLPIVGYNLLFDERFLQTAVIRTGIVQFNNKMVDVLPYVKTTDKFCDNYHLTTVLAKYGVKNEQPHNSLADATATMELVNKLIKIYGFRI